MTPVTGPTSGGSQDSAGSDASVDSSGSAGPGGVTLAGPGAGSRIVVASSVGTAVFAAASAIGAATEPGRSVAVAVDLVLFAAGTLASLVAFARAVGRSRTEIIAVSSLFFLSGSAPTRPRTWLLGGLAAQVVIALTAAGLRPFTGLAFGVLVPVWGIGMLGLWGARHGAFPARTTPSGTDRRR